MKTIKGDLIELAKARHFDIIVHGCNCFNTMNSGIAKQIKKEFPQAFLADMKTAKGDKAKLGTISGCCVDNVYVFNAYTQYCFGYDPKISYVNYGAVRSCFKMVAEQCHKLNNLLLRDNSDNLFRIGIPKIGAGLAGGDWNIISKIIEEETVNLDVTVVEYNG